MSIARVSESFSGSAGILGKPMPVWFSLVLVFLFFSLSVQHKPDNEEAVRPLYLLGLVLLMAVVAFLFATKKKAVSAALSALRSANIQVLVILLSYIFLSAVVSGLRPFKDALYFLYWYLLFFLFFWILIDYGVRPGLILERTAQTIIWFAAFSAIVGVFVFFGILSVEVGSYKLNQNLWVTGRLHGFMGEPTSLGGLLGVALLCLLCKAKQFNSAIYLVLAMLLTIGIFWSGSRNGLLSLIVAFSVYSVLGTKVQLRKFFTVILLIPLVFAFLAVSVLSYLQVDPVTLLSVLDRGDYDGGDENSRLFIWRSVVGLFSNGSILQVLVGHGFGGIREEYRAPFNGFLEILFDFGLVGLLLFVLFILIVFLEGYKKYVATRANVYRFGLCLTIYSVVFSMFASLIPAQFFNFSSFSLIFGVLLVSIPSRYVKDFSSCDESRGGSMYAVAGNS